MRAGAKRAEITLDGLIREAADIQQKATESGALSAAITALIAKAKPQAAFVRKPCANAAAGRQVQASGCARSRSRSWPDLSVAAARLFTRHSRPIPGTLGNDPIDAFTVRLFRLQPESQLLAHHAG